MYYLDFYESFARNQERIALEELHRHSALMLYNDSFPVGQETIIENSMKFIALLLPKSLFECIGRVVKLSFIFFLQGRKVCRTEL